MVYDLAEIASEPGPVLEIAVRNTTSYADISDFNTKLSTFLDLVSQQDGFVKEYQWIGSLDPFMAVGMTVYESQGAYETILGGPFVTSSAVTDLLSTYPPTVS